MGRYVSTMSGLGAIDPSVVARFFNESKQFCIPKSGSTGLTPPVNWTTREFVSKTNGAMQICYVPPPASARPPMPGAADPMTTQPLPGLPTSTPPAPSDTTVPAAPPPTAVDAGIDVAAAKEALAVASQKTGLPTWALVAVGLFIVKKVLF